jgi:hypothetical protein
MQDHNLDRPALRPAPMADYPPGRKRLSPRWWDDPAMREGTTLRARQEHRERRAAKPLKHDPDVMAHKAAKSYANWCWTFAPECLAWGLSSALH